MKGTAEGEAVRLVVMFLRSLRRWDQRTFAEESGVDQRDISRYETGEQVPRPETLQRLASAAGVSPARLGLLLEVFRQTWESLGSGPLPLGSLNALDDARADAERISQEIAREVAGSLREVLTVAYEEMDRPAEPLPPPDARAAAVETWRRFQAMPVDPADPFDPRRWVIEYGEEFQSWAFCELLCAKSAQASADPLAARELAELAVYAAEQPAPEARQHLQGYAWGFVADARRRLGDVPGAAVAFARARELWAMEEASLLEPLDEGRWLGLSAALKPN